MHKPWPIFLLVGDPVILFFYMHFFFYQFVNQSPTEITGYSGSALSMCSLCEKCVQIFLLDNLECTCWQSMQSFFFFTISTLDARVLQQQQVTFRSRLCRATCAIRFSCSRSTLTTNPSQNALHQPTKGLLPWCSPPPASATTFA